MRATLDLDDPTEIEIIQAWHTLKRFGDGRPHGRVSSSGEGVHLKVHECDPEKVDYIRRVCGDDSKRRAFDRNSDLKPKQILFSSKPTGEGAGEWSERLDRVLAEYRRRSPVGIRYPELG